MITLAPFDDQPAILDLNETCPILGLKLNARHREHFHYLKVTPLGLSPLFDGSDAGSRGLRARTKVQRPRRSIKDHRDQDVVPNAKSNK